MQIFVFNPTSKRETLRSFEQRVQEYCLEIPVVSIQAVSFGSNLILTLTDGDDVDQPGMPTFMPVLRKIDEDNQLLEEDLAATIEHESAKNSEDEVRVPVGLIIVPRADKPKEGWAILLVVNGEVDDDQGGDDEGGEDPNGGPVVPTVETQPDIIPQFPGKG